MFLRQRTCILMLTISAGALALATACDGQAPQVQGGSDPGNGVGGGKGGGGAGGAAGATTSGQGGEEDLTVGAGGSCEGLQCQQVACDPDVSTTVTGTVYAPEGTIPLYNVVVYVPNAPLDPMPDGTTCDQC